MDIKTPSNILVTEKVFSNLEDAKSAVAGLFYTLGQSGENFSNASTTIICGLSSDELQMFNEGIDTYIQFHKNSVTPENSLLTTNLWTPAYNVVYNANAIIAQLETSPAISRSQKDSLLSLGYFSRAFSYFYLVNFFGDVPLVKTINYKESSLLPRSPVDEVYNLITADLKKAQDFLPDTYKFSGSQRILPTKWAAKSLLARVYLYQKDWVNAILEADSVIAESTLFELNTDLKKVFAVSSREAIWQLAPNRKGFPSNVTQEGLAFIPYPSATQSMPKFFLSDELIKKFDSSDRRFSGWVSNTNYLSESYPYPFKYKEGNGEESSNGTVNEYNTVFRLAELYLIRAEAKAEVDRFAEARNDLNRIRQRAGLADLNANSKQELLTAIYNENRLEFFAEFGHRWMDLKRWGLADAVLANAKGSYWQPTDKLYPIPASELVIAPGIVQNPGY